MEVKIKTVLHKYALLLTLLIFYVPTSLSAQTISAPTLGLPGNPVTAFCANQGSVTYQSTFTISGTFGGGNQFILELSNASGNFSTSTPLSNSPTFSGSTGTFSFVIPLGTSGQTYKFRVRSTSPALISSSSAFVPAYFEPFNQAFFINNKISTINICGSGGSFTLSIDNPTPSEPSPLNTAGITYKWYKGGSVIPNETGSSINISSAGIYFVEIDYGSCTSSSFAHSQNVTVNIVATGATFTVTPGSGTICPSNPITLSTTAGYSYQWFKDDVSIGGAQSYNYVATQPGAYHVVVNQGGCSSSSNIVTLTATDFNASIDVLELPQTNIIATGETKTITVTTDATSPTFEWSLNGGILPETSNVLTTSIAGDYKVIIKQTNGCEITKTILFKLKEGVNPVKIPNVVSPNGDEVNDTWIIPQEYIAENTEILIVSGTGEIALKTNNYQNNWPESALEFKSVNPVYYYIITKDGKEVKKGSITIIK